jgi:hypothetical protein
MNDATGRIVAWSASDVFTKEEGTQWVKPFAVSDPIDGWPLPPIDANPEATAANVLDQCAETGLPPGYTEIDGKRD